MMKENEQITLSWDETVKVFRELELIVVSLDKIGSYCVDKDDQEFQRQIANFIVKWNVAKRLAKARQVLSEKVDDTLGDDDMDDLERAMEGLCYWSPQRGKLENPTERK